MKTPPRLKILACNMAFALSAAWWLNSQATALAQPNPEAPHRRQPPAGADWQGDRLQPGFQPGRVVPMLERVLTEEQRESLRAAMAAQHDQMRGLLEKIRAARQSLMKASLAEKFDIDTVRAKALEVGRLDAELAVLRAKAMSEMQPPLTEQQIERIANPPPPRAMNGPPERPGPGPHRNNRPLAGPGDLPGAPILESP